MTKLTLSHLLEVPIQFLTCHQFRRSQFWRSVCLLLVATVMVEVAFTPPSRKGNPRRQGSLTGTPELLSKLPSSNHQVPQGIA